ncbi:hypothetical protein ACGFQG_32190 [Nocardia fluminea]|uniref:hypothetical protein n=1 Tax=Nocardia fluminea TaxID=134984 RepID=UPI003722736B
MTDNDSPASDQTSRPHDPGNVESQRTGPLHPSSLSSRAMKDTRSPRRAEEPQKQATTRRITSVIRWAVFEFQWSDASEAHIARHNVLPSEVQEAAEKPHLAFPGRNDTTVVLGKTYAGRYLMIVTAEADDGRTKVVTARDMDSNERKAFEQRKGQ